MRMAGTRKMTEREALRLADELEQVAAKLRGAVPDHADYALENHVVETTVDGPFRTYRHGGLRSFTCTLRWNSPDSTT